jgi:peptide/nickel transport system substrate-binding protein
MKHVAEPTRGPLSSARARRKTLSLTVACAAAALVLAACGSSSAGQGSAASSATKGAEQTTALKQDLGKLASSTATPQRGGTIDVAWQQEPPCLYGEWVQIGYLSQQYLQELVAPGSNGSVLPWLATSWTSSKSGLTYTFQLKKGVKFTNGQPFNAAAVVTNFKAWFNGNPATYNGYAMSEIGNVYKSADATGPYTVQVHLKAPYRYFLSVMAQYAMGIQAPAAIAEGSAKDCEDPIGTGPFEVVKWNHGVDVILKRNPNYNSWPANALHKGPAYVNGIVWKFIADDTTRYASLQSGQNDVVYNVPAPDWSSALQKYQVLRYNTGGNPFRLVLTSKWGPFKDVRVRKAFAYAMDRPADVAAAYEGSRVYNADGALGSSTADYDKAAADAFAYNPAKANQLLNQAGWTKRDSAGYRVKDGKELTLKLVYGLDMNVTQDDVDLYQIIQQQEKKVGINLVLVPIPAATFFSSGKGFPGVPGQYDLMGWYWVGRTPDAMHIVLSAREGDARNVNNLSWYTNPKLSALLTTLTESPSAAARKKAAYAVQQLVVNKEALEIGLTPLEVNLAITPKLHHVWQMDDVGEPYFADAYFSK